MMMDWQYIRKVLIQTKPTALLEPIDELEKAELNRFLLATGKAKLTEVNPAAVLIPLIFNQRNNHWDILLTKRASHLKHHAGEICFPGGRYETSDKNLAHTALRETFEEVGIKQQQINIIGRLPVQNTISLYQMTPFVGIVSADFQLNIDKNEVEETFLVPLNFVIEAKNHRLVKRELQQQSFHYFEICYNDLIIWGATARILVNFAKKLNGSC